MSNCDFCRSWLSPSNAVIANVVLRAIDLNIQGQLFNTSCIAIEWHHCECCTRRPWPRFSLSNTSYVDNLETLPVDNLETFPIESRRTNAACNFYRHWHLPAYGIIAYVVRHDLVEIFRRSNIPNINTSETTRAGVKTRAKTFIAVGSRHEMASLWVSYSVNLT